jgi:hypothetical protein
MIIYMSGIFGYWVYYFISTKLAPDVFPIVKFYKLAKGLYS